MEGDQHESEVNLNENLPLPDAWMCRPCHWYKDEYKECTKLRSRLNQYFIFGHSIDCQQWDIDYKNCMNYRLTKNIDSLQKVIDSENERIKKRLKATQDNDVWQLRTEPPKEIWNRPLPKWLNERYESSSLPKYQEKRSKESTK